MSVVRFVMSVCPDCYGNSSPIGPNPIRCPDEYGPICPTCNNLCETCEGYGWTLENGVELRAKYGLCRSCITPEWCLNTGCDLGLDVSPELT